MKTKSILILSLFLAQICSARNDRTRVKTYYQWINKAELALINSDFKSASRSYQAAFKLKYPNGKDLYNAFQAAFYEEDSLQGRRYFNQLAFKGLQKTYFTDTMGNYPLYQYLTAQYDSCYKAGAVSPAARLAGFWDSLLVRDQSVRDGNSSDEIIRRSDSLNLLAAKDYINQHGFPDFEQRGFWGELEGPGETGVLWMLLWHWRPYATMLDSLVNEAVLDGHFRPDDWATILLARTEPGKDGYNMRVWGNQPKLNATDVAVIDKRRTAIYLEPLADYRKKWAVAQKAFERSHTQYNPLIYKEGVNSWYQFVFYNSFLILTTEQIKMGL